MPTMPDALPAAVTEDGVAIVELSRSPINAISVSADDDIGHLTRTATPDKLTGVDLLTAPKRARLSKGDHVEGMDGRSKRRFSRDLSRYRSCQSRVRVFLQHREQRLRDN